MYEIAIEIVNRGNTAIEAAHYERPLSFEFEDGAAILFAEMFYEEPNEIRAGLDWAYDGATLSPVLLNAGDIVGLRFFVLKAKGVRTDGRILRVKKIRRGSGELRQSFLTLLGSVEGLILGPYVFFPGSQFQRIRASTNPPRHRISAGRREQVAWVLRARDSSIRTLSDARICNLEIMLSGRRAQGSDLPTI